MHNDYDVRSFDVRELLAADTTPFVVPEFQRPYSWTRDEIEELFDDVLDGSAGSRSRSSSYFLGAIVLVPHEGSYLVIDGQQRLATISMVIAALRELMVEHGMTEDAEELGRTLKTKQLGQDRKPRLRLQAEDSEAFTRAIDGPSKVPAGARGTHRIHAAALAIRERLLARLVEHRTDECVTITSLAERFLSEIVVVRILATDESAAFRLFESLNYRGRSLTAADLIKNKLFARAKGNLASVREDWKTIRKHVDEDELLVFLRHFWIAFRAPVRRNDLYDAYDQEVAHATPEQVGRLSHDLARLSATYRDLLHPKKADSKGPFEGVEDRLVRMNRLRARSSRPLLMLFADRWPSMLPLVVAICESATIRHALVCQRNPNQLEAAYGSICDAFHVDERIDGTAAYEKVVETLNRWIPNDAEVAEALGSARLRSNLPGWRILLVGIEESLDSGEKRVSGARDVHLEHVFPQVPSAEALRESRMSTAEAKDLTYALGNLTLLSGKRNMSASNSAFSAKRKHLRESSIRMNAAIAEASRWGADEIRTRTATLAGHACTLWQWPPKPLHAKPAKPLKAPTASRSKDRHTANQLPLAGGDLLREDPARLSPTLTVDGTVWIPRLLWALEAASDRNLGPIRGAEIARLLEQELATAIQSTNTSRAFRDLRGSHPMSSTWWHKRGDRFVITDEGRRIAAELRAGRKPNLGKVSESSKPSVARVKPERTVVKTEARRSSGKRA